MKTVVNLDSMLLKAARKEARRRHVTLNDLVEDGLRRTLKPVQGRVQRMKSVVRLPVSKNGGLVDPKVNLKDFLARADEGYIRKKLNEIT